MSATAGRNTFQLHQILNETLMIGEQRQSDKEKIQNKLLYCLVIKELISFNDYNFPSLLMKSSHKRKKARVS